MELSDDILAGIRTAARRISSHGSIVLHFIGGGAIDVEVTDRVRLQEKEGIRAGDVVKEKKVVVIRQERQG